MIPAASSSTSGGAIAWHALSPSQALDRLDSASQGLTQAESAERLRRYGPNLFQVTPPVPWWTVLAGQLRSIIVALLAAALMIALVMGDRMDAAAIGAVLLLNVVIGFATELRAHRAMEGLLVLDIKRARVWRDRVVVDVDARDLAPGDVIELDAGEAVPADARLLEANELRVTEATLTGESVPVDKRADATLEAQTPISDRSNMIFKATTAVSGRGRALVVATGMATEVGQIGALAGGIAREPTLLERRLDALGRQLAGIALVVAAGVTAIGIGQGASLGEIIQTAIALAVAAVPEGLPVVGTIAMAIGMRRMARRRALVRNLPVVETLGSATVICTDKTGTLTSGQMTVTVIRLPEREVSVSGSGYAPEGEFSVSGRLVDPARDASLRLALRIAALASRGDVVAAAGTWKAQGDPTEAALVSAARKAGLDRMLLLEEWPEIAEVPFSSERMLMATYHRTPTGIVCLVKGAPGRVLEMVERVCTAEGTRLFARGEREQLLQVNRELAMRGLRVIALAMKQAEGVTPGDLSGLTWVGFAGLKDPPAPGVAETIGTFRGAGIRTVMITGDQQLTAESIGRELGLMGETERAVDGHEVDRMSDLDLREVVGRTAAFSRVSPASKLRIVAAHQARGEVVAMLGDGVNDAAALRKADIGVAMGRGGTDLAKEAADMILEDDRFATIAAAVEEGRVIFDNVRKFVFYLFSCNLAEILVMLGAGLAGGPLPLRPIQILWLNLLTDTLPALSLAVEPGEHLVMRGPPRDPRAGILTKPMLHATAGYAALIAVCALGAYVWSLHFGTPSYGRATTMTFMTLALAQILHLGNARSEGPVTAPHRALANQAAVAAVLITLLLQVAPVPWFAQLLGLVPLTVQEWIVVIGLALIPALTGQTLKAIAHHESAPR
ncbi:MAG: cation-translocating P-type ATPase [Gemmatimonadales bacterium]